MSKPNLKLLGKLADYLESTDFRRGEFDMQAWYDVKTRRDRTGAIHPCGTSACAIGHGLLGGVFKRCRIKLGEIKVSDFSAEFYSELNCSLGRHTVDLQDLLREAQSQLGLDGGQWASLFTETSATTKRQVVNSIRRFIRQHQV